MAIAECYVRTRDLVDTPDTLEVVEAVEGYRNFWKPNNVTVVLLAESHVHTSYDDFAHHWSYGQDPVHEGNFVRFVYCLANGERRLVDIPSNRGTLQFWKILYSCLNRVADSRDFAPILKRSTPSFDQRMSNKIQLLHNLKRAGIWLVDASIIAINGLDPSLKAKVTRTCWNVHTGRLLESLDPRPKRILVIGKGVEKVLHDRIVDLGVACDVIPQPQVRIRGSYIRHYQTCFDVCSRSRGL